MGFKRWRRIPEAGACPWCRMLAGRDVKYSEAGKFHRRCRCTSELEAGHQPGTDTPSTPADAAKVVQARRTTSDYRLAAYRALGVTDPPLPAWITPILTRIARIQDVADGAPRPPTVHVLIARGQVRRGWTAWDEDSPAEREANRRIAARLLDEFGLEVRAASTAGGKHGPTPDAIFDDESRTVEFKETSVATTNALRYHVRRGRRQSRNIVIDVAAAAVSQADIESIASLLVAEYDGDIDSLLILGEGWHAFAKGRW